MSDDPPADAEDDWRDRDPAWEGPLWAEEPAPAQPPWISRAMPAERPRLASPGATPSGAVLLALAAAEDLLSRLDAGALAAPAAVREGLAARLAFREAAGWLAHAAAWVHPLDLALRDLGLTGSYAAAALAGRLRSVLPVTAGAGAITGWEAEEADSLPEDRAVALSLALARALRRLATAATWRPLASPRAAAEALAALGGGVRGETFAGWKAAWQAETRRLPLLLAAFAAAGRWRAVAAEEAEGLAEAGLRAGFVAAAVLATSGRLWAVPLPYWATVPARPASRWRDPPVLGAEVAAAIPALQQVAEAARGGLRELDRLLAAAEAGARLVAGLDRRSRLGDAVEAALRVPALTPGALARRLKVAPQTATDLLRQLARAGIVREATGRRSFRAFAA